VTRIGSSETGGERVSIHRETNEESRNTGNGALPGRARVSLKGNEISGIDGFLKQKPDLSTGPKILGIRST
jgi:hypothetical protein